MHRIYHEKTILSLTFQIQHISGLKSLVSITLKMSHMRIMPLELFCTFVQKLMRKMPYHRLVFKIGWYVFGWSRQLRHDHCCLWCDGRQRMKRYRCETGARAKHACVYWSLDNKATAEPRGETVAQLEHEENVKLQVTGNKRIHVHTTYTWGQNLKVRFQPLQSPLQLVCLLNAFTDAPFLPTHFLWVT